MSQILFFKPFDYYYFNSTIRNYINIIENMKNVKIIDCNNFNDIECENNPIIIYLPFTLFGISENQFISVRDRIKKAYYAPNFECINFNIANRYYQKFYQYYKNSTHTIAVLTEYDPHALLEDKLIINYLNRNTDYFLLAGPELYDTQMHRSQQPDIDMVKFNKAYDFLSLNRNKIISLSHFVDISEFSRLDDLYKKKTRVRSAPGARYINRKLFVSNYVVKNQLDFYKTKLDYIILKSIWQIPWPRLKIGLSKIYFDNIIKRSIFTYTCGSTAGFFIRKFIEIPVYNSCLVTHNYTFLKALGFNENEHYITLKNILDIKSPKDFKIDYNKYNMVYSVILNSRKLIFEKHSVLSHFIYLSKTIEKIQSNTFHGSYWQDGSYQFYD